MPAASLRRWRKGVVYGTWCDSQTPSSGRLGDESLDVVGRVTRSESAKLLQAGHGPVLLGDYQLERLVGSGGMGQVFAARSRASGERVALKLLHRSSGAALLRLKREFRVLADVEHPNLIKLEELVVPPTGEPFFTMELVDGVSFVEYVRGRTRPGQLPDQIRLRRTLQQLLAALEHLHHCGYVHRDLKPSNVLVAGDGRVVVLDFGLVCDADTRNPMEEGIVGTPAYMAPEQARWGHASPAADIYAVGVMIYECLCGLRPFVGRAEDVLLAKVDLCAPDPILRTPQADADLLDLCRVMLARDPQQRPGASDVLAQLEHSPRKIGRTTPFIGRKHELGELDRALALVRDQARPLTMMLSGPSGRGKSALLQRWARDLDQSEQDLLILRGRCDLRESMAYKGLDTVIDALSRHLRALPEQARERLRPTKVEPLTRLFPVLAGIWTSPSRSTRSQRHPDLGPVEPRELALEALRELLWTLASERPTVVVLDDFQWADTDSARLLRSMLDDPTGPPLLLVIAHRQPSAPGGAVAELRALSEGGRVELRELELGPLRRSEAPTHAKTWSVAVGTAAKLLAKIGARPTDGGTPTARPPTLRSRLTRSTNRRVWFLGAPPPKPGDLPRGS